MRVKMKEVIGREREIDILSNLLKSTEAELLAVYGRRRVGKTFLISTFYSGQGLYFEMTGIKGGSREQQIKSFVRKIKLTFGYENLEKKPKDWFTAFEILEEAIERVKGSKKIILFFDEFPWMYTHKSDLLPAFEFLWNSYLSKNQKIITIICGSAISWMIKKIINNKDGLYGRLTARIRLKPFNLKEIEEYFIAKHVHLDRKQIVEVSMALGGIPKYLSYVETGQSSAQIIQKLCFTPGAPLTTEFHTLYESLFEDHQTHIEIIETLAKSKTGLTNTQISQRAGKGKGGSISKALKELVASNFVQFVPFHGRKSRDGLYRVVDEYSYFYLNWIEKAIYNYDESISQDFWLHQQSSAKFKSWAGYVFESVVFRHIRQVIKALHLSVVAEKASYWSHHPGKFGSEKGAQIDLVIDRRDQCINLCEVKFWASEYTVTEAVAKQLTHRREIFKQQLNTKKSLFNTLITPYGAPKNKHYLSSVENQLTLEALFTDPDEEAF